MKKAIFESIQQSEKKKRKCMFSSCQDYAIKSHVLQKNGILHEISVDNHLIERVSASLFEMEEKGISDFKRKGINNVYTFNGFCQKHDTELFKPIETERTLNLYSPDQQLLFCYRGLCQEIRRKEIALELLDDFKKIINKDFSHVVDSLIDGNRIGVKNLNYFKSELESSIDTGINDNFYFETLEIERIELCISVPLNVGEDEIPEDGNYDEWKKNHKLPFVTSFLNVFPKGSSTYIIVGYHKEYPCNWTRKFINKLKCSTRDEILKELSDLVTLRLEFWALSIPLFEKIDKSELKRYHELIKENVWNHGEYMETDINLFRNA